MAKERKILPKLTSDVLRQSMPANDALKEISPSSSSAHDITSTISKDDIPSSSKETTPIPNLRICPDYTKKCCYVGCETDATKTEDNVFVTAYPKPLENFAKCLRWVEATRPLHNRETFLKNISGQTMICSKHFFEGKGPTVEHPDPIKKFSEFEIYPNTTHLHQIVAPVGWVKERIENEGCIFSKKRKERYIMQFTIQANYTYCLKILESPAPETVIQSLPKITTLIDAVYLLDQLNYLSICSGNFEKPFVDAFLSRNLPEGRYCTVTQSVYSSNCAQTTSSLRCSSCSDYRAALRLLIAWLKQNPQLTRSDADAKIKDKKKRVESAKIARIVKSMEKLHQRRNVDIKSLLEENIKKTKDAYIIQLFLRDQLKNLALGKKSKGMWHPNVIKWCNYIKDRSPRVFDDLMQSKLRLPVNYFSKNNSIVKFDVIDEIAQSLKLDQLAEHQKYFSILISEISIEDRRSVDDDDDALIVKQLQFLLRGIVVALKCLFAHFSTTDLSGAELHHFLWETIKLLEARGFKILAIVSDGNATNLKFFEFCNKSYKNETRIHYCTKNPAAADESRDIYFFCDAPMLIKTVRNSLASSGFEAKRCSKLLCKNNEHIVWDTIVKAFQNDAISPERLLRQVTYNHIHRHSPSAKTKLSYATHILSSAMAEAIENNSEIKHPETVIFLQTFGRFFDLLNVKQRLTVSDNSKINSDERPYTLINDERLQWLTKEFVKYLDNWAAEIKKRPESKEEKERMILSERLLHGFQISAMSTAKVVEFILNRGVPNVLTSRLNHDPFQHRTVRSYETNQIKVPTPCLRDIVLFAT